MSWVQLVSLFYVVLLRLSFFFNLFFCSVALLRLSSFSNFVSINNAMYWLYDKTRGSMQPVIAQLFNNFSLICCFRVVRLCLNIQWFWSMINVLIMTAKFWRWYIWHFSVFHAVVRWYIWHISVYHAVVRWYIWHISVFHAVVRLYIWHISVFHAVVILGSKDIRTFYWSTMWFPMGRLKCEANLLTDRRTDGRLTMDAM